MPNPRSRLLSSVAAVSISALTLATFYLLRNYGPEKAVWRFHHAALSGDQLEVARVTMQSPNTASVQILESFLREADKASPQVISYRETTTEAYFSILYRVAKFPGRRFVVNWIVEDTQPAGWVIDSAKTLNVSPGLPIFLHSGISPPAIGHYFPRKSVLG